MRKKIEQTVRLSADILSCQKCSGMYEPKTDTLICDDCGDEISYIGLCKYVLFHWEMVWLKSQIPFTLSNQFDGLKI